VGRGFTGGRFQRWVGPVKPETWLHVGSNTPRSTAMFPWSVMGGRLAIMRG
jgi:hypothetical protein